MKSIISPLKLADYGADVVNLQDALLLLIDKGLIRLSAAEAQSFKNLLSQEQQDQAYKDGTSKVVAIFQQQHHQTATGAVDAPTADDLKQILKDMGAVDSARDGQKPMVAANALDFTLGFVNPAAPISGGPRAAYALASGGARAQAVTKVVQFAPAVVSTGAHAASGTHMMMEAKTEGSSESGAGTSSTSSSSSSSSSSQPPEDFDNVLNEAMNHVDEGKSSAIDEPVELTSHAQSAAARAERGIVGQSAHTAPHSALRTLPPQELFNTVRDVAGSNPNFSTMEAKSVVELLKYELFVQMGLHPNDPVRLPYSK